MAEGKLSRLACARASVAGIDATPLMMKAGVTRQQLEEKDVWLSAESQIKLVELIAEQLQDDHLGFHLARDVDLREMGLLYYVLNSSDLLGDVLRRAERYCAIVNEAARLQIRNGKELALAISYVGVQRHSGRHQIEAWVTLLVRICRQLTSRHLRPSRVSFVHQREGGSAEMTAFMGCDITFGADADEVIFFGPAHQLPVLGADPHLNRLLVKYCEEARSHRAGSNTFRVKVENAIAPLLPHGKARAPEIGRRLGMSQRTLGRRLAAEGLTFAVVLDRMRADLARRYLQEDLPISQIGWLLGYREASSFNHAYKRMTGETPREARVPQKKPAAPIVSNRRSL